MQPLHRVLRHSQHPERAEELLQEDSLTPELAYRIHAHSQCDLGLAVRAIPDPTQTTQNLSPSMTYMAVGDANGLQACECNLAGRGQPDLTRITLYVLYLGGRTLKGT